MTPSATALRVIASEAARAAGELLRERFLLGGERSVSSKSTPTDLVSEADLAAEQAIRRVLRARRPGDPVLGEEGGQTGSPEGGLHWIVDPLDGTVNFLFGVPQWCVSVAVCDADGALAGVVFDPMRDEIFVAQRDTAATVNGTPLKGSVRAELPMALVATGYAYDSAVRARQAEVSARLLPQIRDLRRMGSAALDLAWCAAGRYDAYYERGVKTWDIAAGSLICERAGLAVRPLVEKEGLPDGIIAANPALIDQLERYVA